MTDGWKIRGELILSCNCDVFCPCVIALGKAKPTYGVCHTWWGLHIDEGRAGDESLDGLNVGVLMDIPGPLAEGKWSVAFYIDERASDAAAQALTEILSGKAGGTTSWFSIMVAEFLGVKRVPIEGANGDGTTKITNTKYWMGAEVTVCRSTKSRFRDWGRNWELTGGSGEYARIDWEGP
jgi:hypothetical protein